MKKSKMIEVVFAEWKASLKSRDRSYKGVRANFEDLFQRWKDLGATFDDLYDMWLPRAIKAHQPPPHVARSSYKKIKSTLVYMGKTESEFVSEWNKSIEDTATACFFEFFPVPTLEEDNEPKVYGSMSAREYRAQRRYAEQFPILDTEELEKQWRDNSYNLEMIDLINNVLGKEDEANV